ncbi:MAG: hypothetical protein M3Y64_11435 [Gemmatimonadota bacterium]|nr:hypothetical protein [Gemmatimonadota bacterium]
MASTTGTATPALLAGWSDATSNTAEAQVYRLWQEYYRSKAFDLRDHVSEPSLFWAPEEQAKWLAYDLPGLYQPSDGVAEVEAIRRVSTAQNAHLEISIRYRTADSGFSSAGKTVPLKFVTLTFAAFERDGTWMLANVLPFRAAPWHKETMAPITFYVDPTLTFNRERAQQAVYFVDSIAIAFGVPKLEHLDYYVASSVDAANNLIGVTTGVQFGSRGGFAKPANHQIFSGDPLYGENYRHELVHEVLLPLAPAGTSIFVSEGLATWLGGTSAMTFSESVKRLSEYLLQHPRVTLDSAMERAVPQAEFYASGAVLCHMIFQKSGVAGIRRLFATFPLPSEIRAILVEILGQPWQQIVTNWRKEVARLAGAARS